MDDTEGYLLVDAYSGYNAVAKVSRRKRAACHVHLRRYFHEALPTAKVAQEAIDLILELYCVEHDAKAKKILGTAKHLALRRTISETVRQRLVAWLDTQQPRPPSKSPIGVAIQYAQNHWEELGRFLDEARIRWTTTPRRDLCVALLWGPKNFLFVGDVDAGGNIAGLYTLIATCEARGINPLDYRADVIPRLQDHPAQHLDELLPGAWAAMRAAA